MTQPVIERVTGKSDFGIYSQPATTFRLAQRLVLLKLPRCSYSSYRYAHPCLVCVGGEKEGDDKMG